ncbi:hypothetical protein AK830_g6948 [Neonectria ditissima]|uniref:Uncharacterized protein n=1 Tax=Neonectria ditissima TaxID=78410 RepID=A0A0P7BB85_9HYPO|nr:hypothetical protein AK830_g6948 [Neonectria ditissima]
MQKSMRVPDLSLQLLEYPRKDSQDTELSPYSQLTSNFINAQRSGTDDKEVLADCTHSSTCQGRLLTSPTSPFPSSFTILGPMSFLRSSSAARFFIGLFITAGIFTYYTHSIPSLFQMEDDPAPGPIAGIKVSLEQKTTSPPTVIVKVTNTNTEPATFLSYASPLDGLVLQLGLLSITPDGASAPLEIPRLEVQRKWPPAAESFITFAPGETQQQDIVLKEQIVSQESLGAKATVQLKGKWQAVWAKAKGDISNEALEKAGLAEDAYSGAFSSNELQFGVTA